MGGVFGISATSSAGRLDVMHDLASKSCLRAVAV